MTDENSKDDGITVLDLLIDLAKHKRSVIGLPVAAGAVAMICLVLFVPNIYTATTRIMPPQQGQAAAAAFNVIAGYAGGAGAALAPALGLKNPNDLYVGILKGDSIADRMIERFNLKQRFDKDTTIETRKALEDITNIRSARDGLIVVEVDDKDPKMAAAMANAYVEELDRLTQQLAVTEASQRRLFFERELTNARKNLANSEAVLLATQKKTGLIQPEGQARAIIGAFAELRALIAAKEVELTSMRIFATAQNPDRIRAQEQLVGLYAQLAKLEKANPGQNLPGNILVPTTQVPEAGLEYLRGLRDLKYQETLYELLAKQYELAKIEEAKDAGLLQVVDKAIPPDRKSKPKRALLSLLVVIVGGILVAIWAILLESIERTRLQPEGATRLRLLKSYLRWR